MVIVDGRLCSKSDHLMRSRWNGFRSMSDAVKGLSEPLGKATFRFHLERGWVTAAQDALGSRLQLADASG